MKWTEWLRKGKKVDLIITDPPCNSGGMFQKKEVNNGKVFKTNNLEIEDWLPKFWELLKDQSHCYIMTNNKNITHYFKVAQERIEQVKLNKINSLL